jgi:2-polyprenyl-3-methyl-5-hydroxy-6-metoxy-1,4-benzoquinol methylase
MSPLNNILLSINRLLSKKKRIHPLMLDKESKGAYARWEYDLAKKTLLYFPDEMVNPKLFEGKRVLDLCCGAGGKSVLLAQMGARVTAVDIDEGFIDMARDFADSQDIDIDFQVGDARDLRFEEKSFDYVFSFDALEHVDPPEDMLTQAKRVLVCGGRLIMSFTNWERHDGHHMTDAISLPWIHLMISQKRLLDMYRHLVGDDMYVLRAGSLESERIAYVNRLRLKTARRIIEESGFKRIHYREITYGGALGAIAGIPGMKKYLTRVITTVLEV